MGIRVLLHGCKSQIGQSLCVMPLCRPGKEGSQDLLDAYVCLCVPACITKECTLSPLGMRLLAILTMPCCEGKRDNSSLQGNCE